MCVDLVPSRLDDVESQKRQRPEIENHRLAHAHIVRCLFIHRSLSGRYFRNNSMLLILVQNHLRYLPIVIPTLMRILYSCDRRIEAEGVANECIMPS